jgi:3-deoxy-D-manno-octulosonate 8-phosphate phosphatase KdsC-like HAD superfamily phosphatase
MFQKLRSDLVKELSPIRLLLVNADGFATNGAMSPIKSGLNGNCIDHLRDQGVECVAFSGIKSQDISSVAENLGIELHEGVSDREEFYAKMKDELSLMDNEIALICRDGDDLQIMKKTVFSAVTPDAPLDVKVVSYYPTYFNGANAVKEIAELILKAKRYPDGWSE